MNTDGPVIFLLFQRNSCQILAGKFDLRDVNSGDFAYKDKVKRDIVHEDIDGGVGVWAVPGSFFVLNHKSMKSILRISSNYPNIRLTILLVL